jgi:6,7-dimethyl-8-ribityllumazine synthase
MVNTIEGNLDASELKFGIVVSRYNEFITGKLLDGALDSLRRHGAPEDDIDVVWLPGSFEVALAAKRMVDTGKYDAIICLGAVIRGDTSHFDLVAGQSARSISQVSLQTGVPVIFGVITTETIEQAIERAGTRLPNRGFEAATTAIETANALRKIQ